MPSFPLPLDLNLPAYADHQFEPAVHPWTHANLLKENVVLTGFIQIVFDSNATFVVESLARALEFQMLVKSWSGNIPTCVPHEPRDGRVNFLVIKK